LSYLRYDHLLLLCELALVEQSPTRSFHALYQPFLPGLPLQFFLQLRHFCQLCIKVILARLIGQIEPVDQQIHAQHAFNADQRSAIAGLRVVRLDQGAELTLWASETVRYKWFDFPRTLWLMALPAASVSAGLWLWHSMRPGIADWKPFAGTVIIYVLAFLGLAYHIFPYIVVDRMTIWDAAAHTSALQFMLWGRPLYCRSLPATPYFHTVCFVAKCGRHFTSEQAILSEPRLFRVSLTVRPIWRSAIENREERDH